MSDVTAKKILFITGTRADFGKMKALIKSVEGAEGFEAYVYVCGMHLLPMFGATYREVLKEDFKNVYIAFGTSQTSSMSINLGNAICMLTGYIENIQPDMIVVHGDRTDALAGAVVGALNNVMVAHIEGGELSGTIDESIRHAVSKFAHIHLVSNEESRQRLLQLGEEDSRIYVIGSPDIDIMMSSSLPSLDDALRRYSIPFDEYGILLYHPVTTEYMRTGDNVQKLVDAVLESGKQYVVIYPNNDLGSEVIINEYQRLSKNSRFRLFPSIRFEYFLTLLKNARFMVGNSSAGIRETCIYGVPSIDIGTRQDGRVMLERMTNIRHVDNSTEEILDAIGTVDKYRHKSSHFGEGNSSERFMSALNSRELWDYSLQKKFIDFSLHGDKNTKNTTS